MSTRPWAAVKRLGPGLGRDYVVGDIHGEFELLRQALDALHFNPKVDRLFSVGDLVDRGPYSSMALELLQEPWVHAVRGNHEQMLLDIHAGPQVDQAALDWNVERNGMGWWLEEPPARQQRMLQLLQELPLAIEVETPQGLVALIHAEVPPAQSWPQFAEKLCAGELEACTSALWGRNREQADDCTGVPGLFRLFVGHVIHPEPTLRGNIVYTDTGAYRHRIPALKGRHLSMLPLSGELSQGVRVPALLES